MKMDENAFFPGQSWPEYPNPTTQYHLLLMKVRRTRSPYGELQYGRTHVRCTERFHVWRCSIRLTLRYGSEMAKFGRSLKLEKLIVVGLLSTHEYYKLFTELFKFFTIFQIPVFLLALYEIFFLYLGRSRQTPRK